jgi:hypothetical protein
MVATQSQTQLTTDQSTKLLLEKMSKFTAGASLDGSTLDPVFRQAELAARRSAASSAYSQRTAEVNFAAERASRQAMAGRSLVSDSLNYGFGNSGPAPELTGRKTPSAPLPTAQPDYGLAREKSVSGISARQHADRALQSHAHNVPGQEVEHHQALSPKERQQAALHQIREAETALEGKDASFSAMGTKPRGEAAPAMTLRDEFLDGLSPADQKKFALYERTVHEAPHLANAVWERGDPASKALKEYLDKAKRSTRFA